MLQQILRFPAQHELTRPQDGTRVAAGDSTGHLNIVDFRNVAASGQVQAQQAKAHEEAIKCVRWFQTGGQDYVATGSWDKTVKFWDLKNAQPVATLSCQDRIYSMDIKDQLLVVATAERHINMINLNEPTKIYKTIVSPLKWQTRVVSCFTDASGFAVGSIEGRCAIQYVEDKDTRYDSPSMFTNPPLTAITASTSPSSATANKTPRSATSLKSTL